MPSKPPQDTSQKRKRAARKHRHDPDTGRYVTKLDAEARERAITALRHGMPLELAADYAGVARTTLMEWLRIGRAAIASANGDLEAVLETNEYAGFTREASQVIAEFVLEKQLLIERAGTQDTAGEWQPNAWLLERRFWQHYGRRSRTEVTGPGGGPIQHAVTVVVPQGAWERLSLEERGQLSQLLSKIEGEVIEGEAEELAIGP